MITIGTSIEFKGIKMKVCDIFIQKVNVAKDVQKSIGTQMQFETDSLEMPFYMMDQLNLNKYLQNREAKIIS